MTSKKSLIVFALLVQLAVVWLVLHGGERRAHLPRQALSQAETPQSALPATRLTAQSEPTADDPAPEQTQRAPVEDAPPAPVPDSPVAKLQNLLRNHARELDDLGSDLSSPQRRDELQQMRQRQADELAALMGPERYGALQERLQREHEEFMAQINQSASR